MNLTDLKTKSTQELIDIAKDIGIDNVGRSRKQDIIFKLGLQDRRRNLEMVVQ